MMDAMVGSGGQVSDGLRRAPSAVGAPHSYRPDIDGLRAVAVLAVVAYHAYPRLVRGGYVGVDVFFVISGYLITGILLGSLQDGTWSIPRFYARRARRIFPSLAVVLLGTLALGALVLLPDELLSLGRHATAGALFSSNILLWSEAGYFDAAAESKPLLHLWSLAIEEQFYLVWPIMLAAIWRSRSGRAAWWSVAMAASFALSIWMSQRNASAGFFFPVSRFWELWVGAVLAWVTATRRGKPLLGPLAAHASGFLGLLAIGGSIVFFQTGLAYPGYAAALPVAGTAGVIASGPGSIIGRVLGRRPLVYIGLISYPLYLWHWPLLVFLRLLNWGQALGVNNIWASRGLKILTLGAAAGLAAVTYHAIERRVRRASERNGAMFGVAALCAAVACGVAVTGSKGMPWRLEHPERVAALAWPDTLQLHPACVERYGEPFTGRDRFCATNAPPDRHHDVLLLGDSHANALWPGVSAANPGMATMLGATGCPPLRDIHVWLEGEGWNRDKCPEIMRRAFDVVADTVDMVVLASRMPEYLSGRGYGEAEEGGRALMAEGAAGDARPRHAMLRDDFARDLRWLARRARRVVVVLPLPELGFAMDECVGGRPIARMLGTGRHRCEVPRADVERRQAGARRLIGEAVVTAGAANVAVVDPMDVLCDATSCSAVRDGLVLYRDDDHLSVEGARYVWSRLAASAPRTVD